MDRLIERTRARQQSTRSLREWLITKLGATRITQKLETPWNFDEQSLIHEVRRAGGAKLSPAARRSLIEEHRRHIAELTPILTEIRRLEIDLQHQIFDLYGLTPEEIHLLRTTAPPRDPLALVETAEAEAS